MSSHTFESVDMFHSFSQHLSVNCSTLFNVANTLETISVKVKTTSVVFL